MTVYELIKDLTDYDPNAEVEFIFKSDLTITDDDLKDDIMHFDDEIDFNKTSERTNWSGKKYCTISLEY